MRGKYKQTKKSILIRIYTIAAAILIAGGFISGWIKAARLGRQNDAHSERALYGLTESVEGMDICLQRCRYCTGEQYAADSALLLAYAREAQLYLEELPDIGETDGISRFISQATEIAMRAPDDDGGEHLRELCGDAERLREVLEDISARIGDGDARSAIRDIADGGQAERLDAVNDDIAEDKNINGNVSEYVNRVSMRQAAQIAGEFACADELWYCGTGGGELPCYVFCTADSEIAVTRRDGRVIYILGSRQPEESYITADEAENRASRFLRDRGFSDMRRISMQVYGNRCTIAYAYEREGILYYPDTVKLTLAMDDGGIISFDASGYIMSHTDRKTPPRASYTFARAQAVLSEGLNISGSRAAVISQDGGEVLCYEFLCSTADGSEALVYINAATLEEEKISLLVRNGNEMKII